MTVYQWRGPFTDVELNRLHGEAFDHPVGDTAWWDRVQRHSLGWVTARDAGRLIGFVNVVWDGGAHAFLLDTCTTPRLQGRGVGTALVSRAAAEATAAGCDWLHVDFVPELERFYLTACGFRATTAGLINLR